MAVVIRTDSKWRNFKYGYELPAKWRKEKSWIENDEEYATSSFVKTPGRNAWYFALDEFLVVPKPIDVFRGWDGYINTSYYNGYVIKVSSDGERYKIGYFYDKGE